MQRLGVLRSKVGHRVDSQAPDERQPAVHPGDLEKRALVHELEEPVRRDPGPLRESLAVDVERRAVEQLVGVMDADGAKASNVGLGDAWQVLERPVHPVEG